MTYYTPIAIGAGANAATINNPLAQIDAQLVTASGQAAVAAAAAAATNSEISAARNPYATLKERLDEMTGGYSGGNIATLTNGTAAAGQKNVTVDDTTGFLVGGHVAYQLIGGALEYNVIASITPTTVLVMTTNIGTGGIDNNVYIGLISINEYLAAQAIPHSGSLTLPQTIEYANGGVFNVKAYGAVGNGTVDDTAAIQAALTALQAAGGGTLFLPRATYLVSTYLTCVSAAVPVIIEGNGSTIVRDYSSYDVNASNIILIDNVASKTTTVTAAITAGAIQLTVGNTTGMAMGDMILLESDEIYSGTYVKGFGSTISKVTNTTTIQIADPVPYAFTVTDKTINVKVYTAGNPCIVRNLRLKWTGAHSGVQWANGLMIRHRQGAIVENVCGENASQSYLEMIGCVGARVNHLYGAKPEVAGEGYGMTISHTYSSNFSHLDLTTSRHPVALSCGSASSGPCWNVWFDHCDLRSLGYELTQNGRSFDSHCAESAYITDSYLPNGIAFGGGYFYADNCYISNVCEPTGGFGSVAGQRAIVFQRMFSLRNCTIKTVAVAAGLHSIYHVDSNVAGEVLDMGDFEMIGCTIDVAEGTHWFAGNWANIATWGTWRFENNLIRGKMGNAFGYAVAPSVVTTPGKLFIKGNTIQFLLLDMVSPSPFDEIEIVNNNALSRVQDASNKVWVFMESLSNQQVTCAGNILNEYIRLRLMTGTSIVRIVNNIVTATSQPSGILSNGNASLIQHGNVITGIDKADLGPAVAATGSVGSLANKIEVFDIAGVSLGYVPVYATIS